MISLLAAIAAIALIGGLLAAFGRSKKTSGKLEQVVIDEQVKDEHIKAAVEERAKVVRMSDGSAVTDELLSRWSRGE